MEEASDEQLLRIYQTIFGIEFVLLGIFILIYGGVFYKETCYLSFFVVFSYYFTWELSLATYSILLGFFIVLLIAITFAYILYSSMNKYGNWVGTIFLYAILFSFLFVIIAQVIWICGKWTYLDTIWILLIGILGFFIGLLIGYIIEKPEKKIDDMSNNDLERMWVARHILVCTLAAYLILRGITLLYF